MSAPREHHGQLHALTGIRGIAAWFVVLYHIRLSLAGILPGQVIAAFGYGYLAVDLFFMLSGFVLWLNYGARFREGGLGEAPAFWWRRIARIWPLHIAILGALVAFALMLLATGRNTAAFPFAELPLHVLLIQNWGFTDALSWNHPAWSISAELAAYLLFPFLALAADWDRQRSVTLAGTGVVLVIALHLLFSANGHADLGADIPHLGLWRCLAEFAIGILLCALWRRLREAGRAGWPLMLLSVIVLAAGVLAGAAQTWLVPLAFALFLLGLALDRGVIASLLSHPILRWPGEWSYSTYLAHIPIWIAFKLFFVDESLQIGWPALAAYLFLVGLGSATLYHLLEKPAQKWFNLHPPAALANRTGGGQRA